MRTPRSPRPALLAVVAVLAAAAGARPACGQYLVPAGADWIFLDDGSDQGVDWRFPGFDETGWSLGPAELGYGDGDEATVLDFGPDPDDKHITYYFRHAFTVTDPDQAFFTLGVVRDDGAVVYLDGVEIFRSNMPAGPIDFETLALEAMGGEDEEVFVTVPIDAELLPLGEHVLAVEIHQAAADSSDLSFDLRLAAFQGTQKLVPPGDGIVGTALAIDGEFAVLGDDDVDGCTGAAYFYRFDGAEWVYMQTVTPPGGQPEDEFGYAVAIDAGVAVIGAHQQLNDGAGYARAYRFDGALFEPLGGRIQSIDSQSDDRFGWSVDVSVNEGGPPRVAVGAWGDAERGFHAGAAHVFDWNDGRWDEGPKIVAPDGAATDRFGRDVAISGDLLVAGASGAGADSEGAVYMFRRGDGTWPFEGKYAEVMHFANLGVRVDASGDRVIAGTGGFVNFAHVLRYDDNDTPCDPDDDTWDLERTLRPGGGGEVEQFGWDVGIDGNTAIVGAPNLVGDSPGVAFVFRRGESGWEQRSVLAVADGPDNSDFGEAVAVAPGLFLVGDSEVDDDRGAAYVFGDGDTRDLDATYITMTVHGQVAEAFSEDAWSTQPWVAAVPEALRHKVAEINRRRDGAALGRVRFIGIEGDWGQATGIGAKDLRLGRELSLVASLAVEPWREEGLTTAKIVELQAAAQTARASRQSAARIAGTLIGTLRAERAAYGEHHPIFLDIICHSRGTTVTSEILRLLTLDPVAQGPLEINVTYLDIIDSHPSEPDEARPYALSGYLMHDVIVARRANEIITHYHAECAMTCGDVDCAAPPLNYWFGGTLCRLFELGFEAADDVVRRLFYPRGHARPYLGPALEQLCPGSTHTSIEEDFTGAIIAAPVGCDEPPPGGCPLGWDRSSRLGALIADPLDAVGSPVPFLGGAAPGGPATSRRGAGIDEYVEDPRFEDAAALVTGCASLLAHEPFDEMLTVEFDPLRAFMERTVADGFPHDLAWVVDAGEVRVGIDGDDVFALMQGPVTMHQDLHDASRGQDRLRATVELRLDEPTSVVLIALAGDGLDASLIVDTGQYEIGVRHVITLDTERGAGGPNADTITLIGDDAALYAVSVTSPACPADLDADGVVGFGDLLVLLAAWGNDGGPEDLDGSGTVDFGDVIALLAAWGACP